MSLACWRELCGSHDDVRNWKRGPDAGYPLRGVSVVHGRLLATTPFDGVVVQPGDDAQSAAEMN